MILWSTSDKSALLKSYKIILFTNFIGKVALLPVWSSRSRVWSPCLYLATTPHPPPPPRGHPPKKNVATSFKWYLIHDRKASFFFFFFLKFILNSWNVHSLPRTIWNMILYCNIYPWQKLFFFLKISCKLMKCHSLSHL